MLMTGWDWVAAILAQARSLLDWNARNQFCAGCGSKTVSVQAGTKRVCPPRDGARERPHCATRSGIHNVAVRLLSSSFFNIGRTDLFQLRSSPGQVS